MFNFLFYKMYTNESKVKRLINTILKKLEIGEPFNITFNGDKAHINQQRIDSIKSVNGGFLLPLLGTIISHIKSGSGFENKQGGVLPLLTYCQCSIIEFILIFNRYIFFFGFW